jgi:hypothetical protein
MGKPLAKPAKTATETKSQPDLTLVEKAPKQPAAAPKPAETGTPRNTTSNVWRDLHPSRVWPD